MLQRRVVCLIAGCAVLIASAPANAQSPEAAGIAYLRVLQTPDGSISAFAENPQIATAEALLALRVLGQGTGPEAIAAESFLGFRAHPERRIEARRLLALKGGGLQDPAAVAAFERLLVEDAGFTGSAAFASGFAAPSAAEFAALLRTVSEGRSPFELLPLAPAVDLLLDLRRTDGFGLTDEESDAWTTAHVVAELAAFRSIGYGAPFDALASSKLHPQQRIDGAFGGSEPVLTTAEGLLALAAASEEAVGPGLEIALQKAEGYLLRAQGNDGSWNESAYVTAVVLRALASRRPNWEMAKDELGRTWVSLSNPEPLPGTPVTARVAIRNRSPISTPATTVRILAIPDLGGATVILGELFVSSLRPGELRDVAASFTPAALAGRYVLQLVVDPEGLTSELNETDNVAVGALHVQSAVDLAIDATGISFAAGTGGLVTLEAAVANRGVEVTTPFVVQFYRGNPDTSGILLGSRIVNGVAANETARASVSFDASVVNGPTPFHVRVDPVNAVTEVDETNNRAFRFFFPGSQHPVDLAISFADVSVTPLPLREGPATLRIAVRNLSSRDANDVQIEVVANNVLVGVPVLVFAPAGGSGVVTLPVQLRTSGANFTITIDKNRAVNDPNRTNNTVTVYYNSIGFDPTPNLVVESLSPGALIGQQGQMTAYVRNMQGQPASATVVFYRGNPLSGGAVELSRATGTFAVNQYTILKSPVVANSDNTIFAACVNPARTVVETNYNDNCKVIVTSWQRSELTVNALETTLSPAGVNPGEPFRTSVVVRNGSLVLARAVVRLWQSHPKSPGAALLAQSSITIPAKGSVTPSFEVNRPEGDSNVWFSVDDAVPSNGAGSVRTLTSRNLFVKGYVNTGRSRWRRTGPPVVGDLMGDGRPVVVFSEAGSWTMEGRVTAARLDESGNSSELWSRVVTTGVAGNPQSIYAFANDVVLADLEGDGDAEVIVDTYRAIAATGRGERTVRVLDKFGEVLRSTTWSLPKTLADGGGRLVIALGDLNADGTADIIAADFSLVAIDGATGSILFNVSLSTESPTGQEVRVADVDDDGSNDILVSNVYFAPSIYSWGRQIRLYDAQGRMKWAGPNVWGEETSAGLVDLDLDGSPEVVTPLDHFSGWHALSGKTGAFFAANSKLAAWFYSGAVVGPLRQNGLPYVVGTANTCLGETYALDPSLQPLWYRSPETAPPVGPRESVLADVFGLGRPQVVSATSLRMLNIQDGRNGETLFKSELWGGPLRGPWNPTVADVDADGHTEILIRSDHEPTDFGGGAGGYCGTHSFIEQYEAAAPKANVVVFGSVHWKKQPTVWNSRWYVRGQVDEQLRVQPGFQPWKTHNTWNQQFVDEPARVLADLVVASATVSPASPQAGQPATLTATIRNDGGLEASLVDVDFFDGDPATGARRIGHATIPGPLAVRGGSAAVSVSWTSYPDGPHTIYVVVNPESLTEEPYRDDNDVRTLAVTVLPGTALPDVSIAATDVSVSPANPAGGDEVSVQARVRNLGIAPTGSFEVALYDGVPTPTAAPLARITLASLDPNGTATALLSAKLVGGTHLLVLVADAGRVTMDANRTNDSVSTPLFVAESTLPDLAITVGGFSAPASAMVGDVVRLTAMFRNRGAPMRNPVVSFRRDGVLLGTRTWGGVFVSGATAAVSFEALAEAAGAVAFSAHLDDSNHVAEFDEGNNSAQRVVNVAAPDVSAAITTDAATYPAGATVSLDANVASLSTAIRRFDLDLLVRRAGEADGLVASSAVILGASASTHLVRPWSVGLAAPGTYLAQVVVRENGVEKRRAETPFVVLSNASTIAELTVDRESYLPGQQAVLRQMLRNAGSNAATDPLRTTVTVRDGAVELYRAVREVPAIGPGSARTAVDLFDVGPFLAPGDYAVELVVVDPMKRQVAAASTVLRVAQPAAAVALSATISASPVEFQRGRPVRFDIAFSNSGNTALSDEPYTVTVLDGATLTAEASLSRTLSLSAGATAQVSVTWLATAAVQPGDKVAVLSVAGKTLARCLLHATELIDADPPVIAITGVSDGQTSEAVTPVVTVTDASPFLLTATLDGGPFVAGTVVAEEGTHLLVIAASDVAGNEASLTVRFVIDRTPPVVSLAGIADGAVTNAGLVSVFAHASDATLARVLLVVDGVETLEAASAGSVLRTIEKADEGTHLVVLSAEDAAGHVTTTRLSFTIDRTAPVVSLAGVSEGVVTAEAVVLAFDATDASLASVEATLQRDGEPAVPFAGGVVIDEGDYLLVVTAVDLAGNQTIERRRFALDRTPPVVDLTAPPSGAIGSGDATVAWSVLEAHPLETTATLSDGVTTRPVASGEVIALEGDFQLEVSSVDAAGNATVLRRTFAIDRTAPAIVVSGVSGGQVGSGAVAMTFDATDRHPGTVRATLWKGTSSTVLSSGTIVDAEGDYRLEVEAVDAAGNVARNTTTFAIDRTPPVVRIEGVPACTGAGVEPRVVAEDAHLVSTALRLDGLAWAGGVVAAEGTHELVATAVDAAGHQTVARATFVIDLTAPLIVVAGVEGGVTYTAAPSATIAVGDEHLVSSVTTLDGAPYVAGTLIEGEGARTVLVEATDCAGNRSTSEVSFTLRLMRFTLAAERITRKTLLIGLGCAPGQSCRTSVPVLSTAAAQAALPLTVVQTDEQFREGVRANRHDSYGIYRQSHGEDEEGEEDEDDEGEEIEPEVTEHVFVGRGFLLAKAHPASESDWEELLGVHIRGEKKGPNTVLLNGFGLSGPLLAGTVVETALQGALPRASVVRNRQTLVVASSRLLGDGRATMLGFDPEASPSARMEEVLAAALSEVASGPEPVDVVGGAVTARFTVTNDSPGPREIRLALPLSLGATLLEARPAAPWSPTIGAGQRASFEADVRLPAATNPNDVTARLSWVLDGAATEAASAGISLQVARNRTALVADARVQLAALSVSSRDNARRTAALFALSAFNSPPPTTRTAAEARIAHVLEAIDEINEMTSADTGDVRRTLGLLLRTTELEWTVLR